MDNNLKIYLQNEIMKINNLPMENLMEEKKENINKIDTSFYIINKEKTSKNSNIIKEEKTFLDKEFCDFYNLFEWDEDSIQFKYKVIIFEIKDFNNLELNQEILFNYLKNNLISIEKFKIIEGLYLNLNNKNNLNIVNFNDNKKYFVLLVNNYIKIDFINNLNLVYTSINNLNGLNDTLNYFKSFFKIEKYCIKIENNTDNKDNLNNFLESNHCYQINEECYYKDINEVKHICMDFYNFKKTNWKNTYKFNNFNLSMVSEYSNEYCIIVLRPFLIKYGYLYLIKKILKLNEIYILNEVVKEISDYEAEFLFNKENLYNKNKEFYKNIMKTGVCGILFVYGKDTQNKINFLLNGSNLNEINSILIR